MKTSRLTKNNLFQLPKLIFYYKLNLDIKIIATIIITLSALYANISNPLIFILIIIAQSLLIRLAA